MEDKRTILLHNITPDELKELIVSAIRVEMENLELRLSKGRTENYSVQKAAKLLEVSELSVYSYIKKGILPASRIGRKYLIKIADLEKAMKEVKSLKYIR